MTDHWDSIVTGNDSRENGPETNVDAMPARRKPGRPKKTSATTEPVKKTPGKRGRPRKTPPAEITVTDAVKADAEANVETPKTDADTSPATSAAPASENGRRKKKRGGRRKSAKPEPTAADDAGTLFSALGADSEYEDSENANPESDDADSGSDDFDSGSMSSEDDDSEDGDFASLGWNPPARVVRPRGVATDVPAAKTPVVEKVANPLANTDTRANRADAELPSVWDLSRLDEEDPDSGLSDFHAVDISSSAGDSDDSDSSDSSTDDSSEDSSDDSGMILRAPPHSRAEDILSDLFLDPSAADVAETNGAERIGAVDDDSSEFEWGDGESLPIPGAVRSRTAARLDPATRATSGWGSLAGELGIEPAPEPTPEPRRATYRDSGAAPGAGSPTAARTPDRRDEPRREENRREENRRDERRDGSRREENRRDDRRNERPRDDRPRNERPRDERPRDEQRRPDEPRQEPPRRDDRRDRDDRRERNRGDDRRNDERREEPQNERRREEPRQESPRRDERRNDDRRNDERRGPDDRRERDERPRGHEGRNDERRDGERRGGERRDEGQRRDGDQRRVANADADRSRNAAPPTESDDLDTAPIPTPDRTAPTWMDAIRWLVGRNIGSRDRKGGGGQGGRRNDRGGDRRDGDRRR